MNWIPKPIRNGCILAAMLYSAPAIYMKEGANNWKVYYICRDYLGSITHIANSDGSLK